MRIESKLPVNRVEEGNIYLEGGLLGRARGKADNQKAIEHGNPSRDPSKPFGDHPSGKYQVIEVRTVDPADSHSYGPFKLVLKCLEGVALDAANNGRTDLEIHGGDPQADGVSLRATYGCLRVSNAVIKMLAVAVRTALSRGETVEYVCTNV